MTQEGKSLQAKSEPALINIIEKLQRAKMAQEAVVLNIEKKIDSIIGGRDEKTLSIVQYAEGDEICALDSLYDIISTEERLTNALISIEKRLNEII